MRGIALCTFVVLLGLGTALGRDYVAPRMMEPTDCAPLRTATDLLTLSKEQVEQTTGLREQYERDYQAEIEKAQVALDEQYTVKVSDILDDEQKGQLKMLMAAEQTYEDVLIAADEQFRTRLLELFYPGEEDERKLEDARRRLRFLPRTEKDLFQRHAAADDDLRAKHIEVRTRYATETSKIHRQASKVDWKNRQAAKEWQEERDKLLKEADEKYMKGALDLLNEEQSKVFSQAVEAQKKWQEATDNADKTYVETVTAIVGEDRKRQIERHQKTLSRRLHY